MESVTNNTGQDEPELPKNASIAILKMTYCFTFVAIIIVNSILLWRLFFRLKKTRPNILFMFLSLSDIFVAVISIPVLAIALFKPDTKDCFIPCQAFIVFNYFPYGYSWVLTIAIALDRCLVIAKKYKYEKTMTKTRAVTFALILMVFTAGLSVIYLFVDREIRLRSQSILEVMCILATTLSYFFLLCYVRKNTKIKTGNKRSKSRTNARITKVIAYMFFCQVILTLPQWISLVLLVASKEEITLTVAINRRIRYRWMMILRFQNSYLNACILLYNQYKEYKMFQRRNNKCRTKRKFRKNSMENSNITTSSSPTMKTFHRISDRQL